MSVATSGPAGHRTVGISYSNPRERERGKFGPCLQTERRPASSRNRDRMNPPTGRPNEVVQGQDGGFGSTLVRRFKFVFALTTEAHVNCLRRKKKDADTHAHQDSVWYLARDPRSERAF